MALIGRGSGRIPQDLARVSSIAAAVSAIAQTVAWIAARRAGRVNVVDVAWGPGLAGIALTSAAGGRGGRLRRGLLATAVTAWATRLATHVYRAAIGRGEDPRYARMLAGAGPVQRFMKVYLTQGVAQWLISLPIQVAAVRPSRRTWPARATLASGVAVMLTGGIAEAVADRQKVLWKRDPFRGPVLDTGLWSLSRHPNYFGDAAFWWGVYLVAASARAPRWTIVSPLAMTWLLTVGTGARTADRLHRDDPDYAEYQHRVSFFLPARPKPLPGASANP